MVCQQGYTARVLGVVCKAFENSEDWCRWNDEHGMLASDGQSKGIHQASHKLQVDTFDASQISQRFKKRRTHVCKLLQPQAVTIRLAILLNKQKSLSCAGTRPFAISLQLMHASPVDTYLGL